MNHKIFGTRLFGVKARSRLWTLQLALFALLGATVWPAGAAGTLNNSGLDSGNKTSTIGAEGRPGNVANTEACAQYLSTEFNLNFDGGSFADSTPGETYDPSVTGGNVAAVVSGTTLANRLEGPAGTYDLNDSSQVTGTSGSGGCVTATAGTTALAYDPVDVSFKGQGSSPLPNDDFSCSGFDAAGAHTIKRQGRTFTIEIEGMDCQVGSAGGGQYDAVITARIALNPAHSGFSFCDRLIAPQFCHFDEVSAAIS